jgi:hypothetical protein
MTGSDLSCTLQHSPERPKVRTGKRTTRNLARDNKPHKGNRTLVHDQFANENRSFSSLAQA